MMMAAQTFRARAAREGGDGQYLLLSDEARVGLDASTLTVQSRDGASLLHQPLRSFLFAVSGAKLMAVPQCRGPAWVFELLESASAAQAAGDHLRACGLSVREPTRPVPTSPAELDAELERLAGSATFRAYVADMEGALARRQSLGLPSMLP